MVAEGGEEILLLVPGGIVQLVLDEPDRVASVSVTEVVVELRGLIGVCLLGLVKRLWLFRFLGSLDLEGGNCEWGLGVCNWVPSRCFLVVV